MVRAMVMRTAHDATLLLSQLGAPPRLLRHVGLVGEAAEQLILALERLGISFDAEFIRMGVILHDAGKILHPAELDQPGGAHESAGEKLLLQHGVSPKLARICVSHAQWAGASFEERLVALADKLWKGVRKADLEESVIDESAARLRKQRWDLFLDLDNLFERIAGQGSDRLARSR